MDANTYKEFSGQPEFKQYGKTPRLGRLNCVITEKIDGSNALVHITDEGVLWAGSRNRWLQPGKTSDNYDFKAWCHDNQDELLKLGPGYHYGEWWGQGIGRKYDLQERRLSLFNTSRFGAHNPNTPKCCQVVPVLFEGGFQQDLLQDVLLKLKAQGSSVAPGFMRPEGVILYLPAFDQRFKIVFDKHGPSPIESGL